MNKRNVSILFAVSIFAVFAVFIAICGLLFGGNEKASAKVIPLKPEEKKSEEKKEEKKPEEKKPPDEEKKEEKKEGAA